MSDTLITHSDGEQYILWEPKEAVLSQGVGYGVIIGFGLFFSLVTIAMQRIHQKMSGKSADEGSDTFFTAGRSVGTGLTAAVIVSQWTWAATLLQSASVGYRYGVSGPFWYASGATIQILLFSIIAVYMKHNVPKARTFLEIVKARFGPKIHRVFLCFAIMTNLIVTSMLLLGGAAVIQELTGVNADIAAFLIPIGVIAYTMSGGLLATFVASYIHTAIIMMMLCIFLYTVYVSDSEIGGVSGMFEKLANTKSINIIDKAIYESSGEIEVVYDKKDYLSGNEGKGYLTMASEGGLIFGIINIVGNFGTVFVDQAYWQSAVAAKPSSSVPGFLIGGLVWFSIPFCLATTFGLATAALNIPISADEVGAGLTAAKGAVELMGEGGAVGLLIMLFMAVTSTGSAELIAVASLFTYDVYSNIYPTKLEAMEGPERDAHLKKVSQYFIIFFGLFMGVLAIILQAININLGYVYLLMGVLIGSAVAPAFSTVVWPILNAKAAVAGVLGGFVMAISTWLIVAAGRNDGEISVATTGQDIPLLAGNIVALASSGLITIIGTLMAPQPQKWEEIDSQIDSQVDASLLFEDDEEFEKYRKMSIRAGMIGTFILIIVWPLPMYASGYVFTEGFFGFWIVVCLIWATVASAVIIILPLRDAYNLFKSFSDDDAGAVKEEKMTEKAAEETVHAGTEGGEAAVAAATPVAVHVDA